VFGNRAGLGAAREAARTGSLPMPVDPSRDQFWAGDIQGKDHLDLADLRVSLQSELWRQVGIERDLAGLRRALAQIEEWVPYVLGANFTHPAGWVLQDMMVTAYAITLGALRREETRGVHFRSDYPVRDDARWGRHQDVRLADLTPPEDA
jgi:L-aspartate oxidase